MRVNETFYKIKIALLNLSWSSNASCFLSFCSCNLSKSDRVSTGSSGSAEK